MYVSISFETLFFMEKFTPDPPLRVGSKYEFDQNAVFIV